MTDKKQEKATGPYKQRKTFDERKEESTKKLTQYPDLVPLIVEKNKRSNLKQLDKQKFLVAEDLIYIDFQKKIREKLQLNHKEALFFMVGQNRIDKPDSIMKNIYKDNKNEDGFLYIEYSNIESFGK